MTRANRVKPTRIRQKGVATKRTRPGKPFNGPNLVAQHGESSKKSARRAKSGR
jgi:hypothetical protein